MGLNVAFLCDEVNEYQELINYYQDTMIKIIVFDNFKKIPNASIDFDLILVDEMYHKEPVHLVCEVFVIKVECPIFMLTKKRSVRNEERAFEHGCSDYIVYPKNLELITKRITTNKVIKKKRTLSGEIKFGANYLLDTKRKIIFHNNKELLLTKRQYEIIFYLVKNINSNVSREELIMEVWGSKGIGLRNVDVQIGNIRKIIPDLEIHTIRDYGYRIFKY